MLKAEGFSYREICAMTGWSYTKVNRLLTEGRRAFLRRVSGIQRGADCARYEPLLSALADGEASAEDLATLRPHMQTCLSCRAALREFRAAPERVAGVLPPVAIVAADGGGPLRSLLESALAAAQHKGTMMGERLNAAAELAAGQKVAVVAASAAALAGGGTAIDELANHRGPVRAAQVRTEEPEAHTPADAPQAPADAAPPAAPAPDAPMAVTEPDPAPAQEPAPPPQPDPAGEFAPSGAAPPSPSSPPSAAAQWEPPPSSGAARRAGGEFAP